jgi:hypothetical protein
VAILCGRHDGDDTAQSGPAKLDIDIDIVNDGGGSDRQAGGHDSFRLAGPERQ